MAGDFSGSVRGWIVQENSFDGQPEQLCNPESGGQAGVKFLLFDGIDRLARHPDRIGQVALGQVFLGTQYADSVLHGIEIPLAVTPGIDKDANHIANCHKLHKKSDLCIPGDQVGNIHCRICQSHNQREA